jgi:hypothetical protein
MNVKQQYHDAATHALAGFQLVEESLKQYIGIYYDAVRFLLKNQLSFQYKREEINDAALERLTNLFSKINANKELVERIRPLIKNRNDVAHRALVHLYGKPKPDAEYKVGIDEFIEVAQKIGVILEDLHKETLIVKKLLGKNDQEVA